MKKIYSLAIACLVTGFSIAQSNQASFDASKAAPKFKPAHNPASLKTNKNNALNKTTAIGGWFNYGTSAETLYGVTSTLSSNYLFPDSLGYGEFGTGTFAGCWVHHLAEMIDFKSVVFTAGSDPNTNWVTPTSTLYIDSLSIYYGYTRAHANTAIVDTLLVTIYDNTTASNLTTSGFAGATAANYGTDTVSFKRIGYNQPANLIASATTTTSAPAGAVTFKILLTEADTAATFYRDKSFALPATFTTSASKLTVASVKFIPGYSYALGDHIDYVANAFFFTSLEEKGDAGGAGTYFTYQDCNFGSASCDYSSSHILPQDVRYDMASTWNGKFIPAMAYGQTYAFEHHLISFFVNQGPVGVKELENNNGVALSQNMPNPFTKESTITYSLVKDASSAVFTVTDVMGRVVSSEKVGATAGNHSISVGSYAAGVYYYSLNVDGFVSTKKMIVE